jgi:hypothetical protein
MSLLGRVVRLTLKALTVFFQASLQPVVVPVALAAQI